MITFFCPGVPVPKGSMRAFRLANGGTISTASNAASLKPWEATIRSIAAKEIGEFTPPETAMSVGLEFYISRPKGHFGKGGLRPAAPKFPAGRPDVDKLARAVLDALTGIAYIDDGQVAFLHATKVYALIGGDGPGVEITIGSMS